MILREGSLPPIAAEWSSPTKPGAAARLLARLRWFSLNERLIAGEDPAGSMLLTAHASRLTGSRRRETVARALEGLVTAAAQPRRMSRVGLDRAAVQANEPAIRAAARRLEMRGPLYARGVARLERLVTDARGPAFCGGVAALARELATAEAELCGAASLGAALRTGRTGRLRPRRRATPRWIARRRLSAGHSSARSGPRDAPNPPGFYGDSFVLPNGSWFHGRRDSA